MKDDLKLTKLSKCAGCGAKVGAGVLAQLLEGLPVHRDSKLIVGYDKSDDASVYLMSDELALIQTVDFFPPIVDDPFLFGQIAAANALSDIYAMGGEPKLALNILCTSPEMRREDIHALLRGGYEKVYEAGAIITGGHTIEDDVPKYGLSVTGFADPKKILTNSAACVGDALILTKPLGVGILATAAKAELAESAVMARVWAQMAELNKKARDIMMLFNIHACTDITGFSLLGHAYEMAQGSGVTLRLNIDAIPYHPEALPLAEMGLIPSAAYRNRDFAEAGVRFAEGIPLAMTDILFDPQTSGGLLIAVDDADADRLLKALQNEIPCAALVGHAAEKNEKEIIVS